MRSCSSRLPRNESDSASDLTSGAPHLQRASVSGLNWAMTRRPASLVIGVVLATVALAGCGSKTSPQVTRLSAVRAVRCPTTFGVVGQQVRVPRSIRASLPAGMGEQLRFYVGGIATLAPAAWNCTSAVGADGGADIVVQAPAADRSAPRGEVAVNTVSACQGCMADLVCPFFPSAESRLGYSTPCPGRKPRGAVIHRLSRDVVSFTVANGGEAVRGLVFLFPPADGRSDSAGEISCKLPTATAGLCEAILNDYLSKLRHQSGPQFAARWSRKISPSKTVPPVVASPPGFLANASNGVLFIQWTRAGNTVTGTLSESYTSQSNAAQVLHDSYSFNGVVSGSSVTLHLDSGENWNGTLGSALTLSYTAADGTLNTFTFNKATVAAYNAAVTQLAAQARGVGNAQARAKTTEQEEDNLNQDASSLTSDVSNLQSAVKQLGSDLNQVPADLTQMRNDLATQKKDLNQLLTGALGCNGGEYQVADSDNYQVTSSDDYQVTSSDAYTINNDQQAVATALATLSSDAHNEIAAQAAMPNYSPAGLPSASEISEASSAASAATRTDKATWGGFLAIVKQLDATSNSYAARAREKCGG